MNENPIICKKAAGRPGLVGVASRCLNMARAFRLGLGELDYPPAFLWIEPTSRCNLRCPMCPQSEGLKRKPGALDPVFLERLADQAAGKVYLVSMHFAGEPLLHKNIAELVGIVSSRGIPTIMHSNGTLAGAEICRALVFAGLDQIVFSFDAVPREDYPVKRPPAQFDITLSRLREFLEEKKRLGLRRPIVTIKSIVFFNEGARAEAPEEFRRLFSGLPVDRFTVEFAHTFSGGFADKVLAGNKYNYMERSEVHCCMLPWYGFAVGWDGTAYACCNDLNGEYTLGNFNERDMMGIWNGPEMVKLRSMHAALRGREVDLCRGCDALYRRVSPVEPIREGVRYAAKYVIRNKVYPGPGGKQP